MIAVTDTISCFFQWWFGELADCVPDRVRAFFRRRSAALALTLSDDDVTFTLHRGGRSHNIGRVGFDSALEPRHALAQLLHGISLRDLDVIVNLPADRVPRRSVTLPLAAQENLREVLGFEIDRHTPFKAGEVAFDYRVTGADSENKRLTVDLAVVPRELLEEASGRAKSFGLSPDRIGVAGEESQADRPFNFLSRGNAAGYPATQRRLLIALTLAMAVLALIAAYLPLYAKERILAARQAQLAESRAAALEAEELKTQLAARLEHGRFLIDRRLSTPAANGLLAEVTERLPNDTWLLQMRWHGKELALSGFSPAAATLIEGLEESPLLSEVRFESPVTADPRVRRERFNISAEVAATGGH
jgi:general secretion pathway protein L